MRFSKPASECTLKGDKIPTLGRYLPSYIHCSTIHNNQDIQTSVYYKKWTLKCGQQLSNSFEYKKTQKTIIVKFPSPCREIRNHYCFEFFLRLRFVSFVFWLFLQFFFLFKIYICIYNRISFYISIENIAICNIDRREGHHIK